ncbi:16451_t:CDS:2, partial [Racocetra persica]
ILLKIELLYMLPYQHRKNNWFPELIYSLEKLHNLIEKVQTNMWDESFEEFKKIKTEEEIIQEFDEKNILNEASTNKLREIIKVRKTKEEIIQELEIFLNNESQG